MNTNYQTYTANIYEQEEERTEEPISILSPKTQQQENDGFVVTHESQLERDGDEGKVEVTPEPLDGVSCPKTQVVLSSLKRHFSTHLETSAAVHEDEEVAAIEAEQVITHEPEEVIVEDILEEEETIEMEKVDDDEYDSVDDEDYDDESEYNYSHLDRFLCSRSDDGDHVRKELAVAAARFGCDLDEGKENVAPAVNIYLEQQDDEGKELLPPSLPKRPTCKSLIFRFIPNAENKGEFEVQDVFAPNELYSDEVDCVIVEVMYLAHTTSAEDYNYAALLEQFSGETQVIGLVAGVVVQSTHKQWEIGDKFKAELPFIIEQRVDDVSEFIRLYGDTVQEALIGHGTFVHVKDWREAFVSSSRSTSLISVGSDKERKEE